MNVQLTINLNHGEAPPTKDAKTILAELGGDPAKDTITVTVTSSSVPPQPQIDTSLPVPGAG